MLKGCVLTVNYPNDEVQAAIPQAMTIAQLGEFIQRLIRTEPEATGFMFVATIERWKAKPQRTYTFKAQHKLYGHWKDVELSDGKIMIITITTNDRAALNTGCKHDFRWIEVAND